MRTTLTVVGIFWGTVSIVLLFAVGKGLHENVVKGSQGLGDKIAIVWPGVTAKGWKGMPPGRRIRYTADDIVAIRDRAKEVGAISLEYRNRGLLMKYGMNTATGGMSGVWASFGDMRNILPQAGGRFLNQRDITEKRRVVFLGSELAEKLFAKEDPVGKTVRIDRRPFVVIGVMQEKTQNSSYSGRDKNKAFIPSTTFQTMNNRRFPSNFVFEPARGYKMKEAIAGVHKVLAARHGYDPTDTKALSIWDTSRNGEFWNTFFMAFRSFLVIIGCFTLITGGIGVANIMHVVVQERTKEVGIKIALGAHKKMIMMQFLAEGLLLVTLGGVLGFAFSYSLITFVPPLLLSVADFNMDDYIGTPNIDAFGTILTVSVLGLVGITSGIFPAKRAANLQPVEAIKLF